MGSLLNSIRRRIGWESPKDQTERHHKELMAALQNLTAATTRLAAAVDKVTEQWHVPNPTEDQIQAAADAVDAQSTRLETLTATPAPEPAGNGS